MRMRPLAPVVVLLAVLVGRAGAQENGCCQFFVRSSAGVSSRQCENLTRPQCATLRSRSTFLSGWQCNLHLQRCAESVAAGEFTPTPTPTAAESTGCCQLDNLRRVGHPVCGNDVSESSCLTEFAGVATFCADCVCSSHDSSGFDLAAGVCVTPEPTPTPTPAPENLKGCCQLEGLHGAPNSICGNEIQQSSCLGDFPAQATFCQNCVCSSHSGSGFTLTRGACVAPSDGRPRGHQFHGSGGPHHPGTP